MKYLTHRFVSSRVKSTDTVATVDDIDEFKFDWISASIIDRAKDVLLKLTKRKSLKGLYIFSLLTSCENLFLYIFEKVKN
jgi:hypothetical protein